MNTTNDLLERNKEVVRHFLCVFSTGNVAGILECLDDDCIWWVSGNVPGISGSYDKQQMGELLSGVVNAYKQGALPITPGGMTAEGKRVAVEAESCSELNNGRVFRNTYHFLFEVDGKRITGIKEYSDTLHLYETFIAE
ncbi:MULTISPECIES: nuclear transport factor 2 family protein [Pseudomonadaceae]|uniref:nuclear transport factor 2 family protein n=1 Tax=Pseudomonadaceae TaxID=135621 RepID=UPI001C449E43|nr:MULTISPECIES: nuclear transport factor 2 family protein [Pseudomonadaceae]